MVETLRQAHHQLLNQEDWIFARVIAEQRTSTGDRSPYGRYWRIFNLPRDYVSGLKVLWDYQGSYNNDVTAVQFRVVGDKIHVKTPYGFGDDYRNQVFFRYTRFTDLAQCPESYSRAVAMETARRLAPTFNEGAIRDLERKSEAAFQAAKENMANDQDSEAVTLFNPARAYGGPYETLDSRVNLDPNNPRIGFDIYNG